MSKKVEVTSQEIDTTQAVSRAILTIATSQEPHIGMGALIMATAVGARAMNIPLENIVSMFDRTTAEVYAVAEENGFGQTVN